MGWFVVFGAVRWDNARLEAFYEYPNVLRDYFSDIFFFFNQEAGHEV